MIYHYLVERTVNGEKVKEAREIDIHEGLIIHGKALDEERELRRFLKLPITKQLVRYERTIYPNWEKHDLEYAVIRELFPDWFVIEMDNGEMIHSMFLSEMQKPDFTELMAEGIVEE